MWAALFVGIYLLRFVQNSNKVRWRKQHEFVSSSIHGCITKMARIVVKGRDDGSKEKLKYESF